MPAKRKPGRPTKLTPEIQATIIADINAGHTIRTAARRAGIHPVTLQRWTDTGGNPDAPAEARAIRAAVDRARAIKKQKAKRCEPITDEQGREVGMRITRHLPNGIIEVTEEYVRSDWRTRARRQAEPDPLGAFLSDMG